MTTACLRKWFFTVFAALVFSLFCVLGRRFDQSFEMISIPVGTSVPDIIKELFLIFLIILLLILFFMLVFTNRFARSFWNGKGFAYCRLLAKKPFGVSFITLLLGYIPYAVISYPTVFMGDDGRILGEGFGSLPLLTHHPVVYTLLTSNTLKLFYRLTASWNQAVFLFSLLQLFFVLLVLSYGVLLLMREAGVSSRKICVLLLFYIVSPVVSNYMFMVTKDVPYAVFILLYGQSLYCALRHGLSRKNAAALGLSCLGIYLFRNEGLYVILLSLLLAILTNAALRRYLLCCFCSVLFLHLVLSRIVWPSMGVGEGSKREMLSIPLLQTARYVSECRDQISEEEEQVLLAAFDFSSLDEMASKYNPNISDSIKNHFEKDLSSEAARNYFKLWFAMGKKRPDIYMAAFLANNYQYYYPSVSYEAYSYAWSDNCIPLINELTGADFHYPPETDSWRTQADFLRDDVFREAPYSVLNNAGIVTWGLFGAFFILLYKKAYPDLHLLIPLFVIMAICLASPCNGYYSRYQYPLMLYLPWVWLIVTAEKK